MSNSISLAAITQLLAGSNLSTATDYVSLDTTSYADTNTADPRPFIYRVGVAPP